MMRILQGTILFSVMLILVFGCEKAEEPLNPYDDINNDGNTVIEDTVQLNPTSIEGLHADIFSKTCANSGCHDGTFEPDFRTIESTYNTLVFHPIIKNDPGGNYTYRVKPGEPDASVLMARLTFDIDGNSGVMPLVIEPDNPWPDEKADHIANIRTWIENGAPDIYGNSPLLPNKLPRMAGVVGKTDVWLDRADGGQGALRIPDGTDQLDIYFAFADEETSEENITATEIFLSQDPQDFNNATVLNLERLDPPTVHDGYYQKNINYYYKVQLNPSSMASLDQTVFFRVMISDGDNDEMEIPSDQAAYYIKDYFSFTIVE